MNKKAYMKPEQRIVELRQRTTLLSGSPYDAKQHVKTYGDPNDKITNKNDIW